MRAVDTNVLVRLVTRDDPKQAAAADEFVAKGAWVPHLALAEATWVLDAVYSLGPGRIATAVDMLLSHEHLAVQDADAARKALAHFRKMQESYRDYERIRSRRSKGTKESNTAAHGRR